MANEDFIINGECLQKYVGAGGEAIVPEGILLIAPNAFSHTAVTSVVLPSSLREIGVRAFFQCASLTSVTCPQGLEKIGRNAFQHSALSSIVLPSTVREIASFAFASCKNLSSVTIESPSWEIGYLAFKNCVSLRRFVGPAPQKKEARDNFLFYGCPHIPAWFLGFTNDQGLKRKTAICWLCNTEREPDEEILSYLRSNKRELAAQLIRQDQATALGVLLSPVTGIVLSLDESEEWLAAAVGKPSVSALLLEYIDKTFSSEEKERREQEKLDIALGLREAPLEEYEKLFSLERTPKGYVIAKCIAPNEKVWIPPTIDGLPVIAIGEDAFRGQAVTEVYLPSTLRRIERNAFDSCEYLKEIIISEGIETIEASAFAFCVNLTSVSLPSSLKTIGNNAFSHCRSLWSISLPEGLIAIGAMAFRSCQNLTSATIPASVRDIGCNPFLYCPLSDLSVSEGNDCYYSAGNCVIERKGKTLLFSAGEGTLPSGEEIFGIGDYAFCGNHRLTAITLPQGVARIGVEAFSDCGNLQKVILPDGVKQIDEKAFSRCGLLKEIILPSTVETLGSNAFSRCESLSSIILPDSLEKIDRHTFAYCKRLASVTFPIAMNRFADSAFEHCANLKVLVVPPENKHYHSDGNCVIETASKTLVLGGKQSAIPSDGTVTAIGHDAFRGRRGLAAIVLPDAITEIGAYAFAACKDLSAVTINKGMKEIEFHAFDDCDELSELVYQGTKEEWSAIKLNDRLPVKRILCSNGEILL